jgi:hypothetical protein
MPVHACGSGCAREGTSSEADPLEGGGDPRARRTSLESSVSPRARRTSLEGAFCGAALVGRRGHRGVDRVVCIFCVRPEVGFAFCIFLQVLSRIPPGSLGDPHGCPRQRCTVTPRSSIAFVSTMDITWILMPRR